MHGFERLRQFNRALQASEAAQAAHWGPFDPATQDLQLAEGLIFGMALVLPFWILVGYAISQLAR
jgi:hypothetical protein